MIILQLDMGDSGEISPKPFSNFPKPFGSGVKRLAVMNAATRNKRAKPNDNNDENGIGSAMDEALALFRNINSDCNKDDPMKDPNFIRALNLSSKFNMIHSDQHMMVELQIMQLLHQFIIDHPAPKK